MFLNSLKPMRSTESIDEVRKFLAAHKSAEAGSKEQVN
jgi:hypothetical protein